MSRITAKYRGHLAALAGVAEEKLEAPDVKGLLQIIEKGHGKEAGKAAKTMLITLNGESILLLKQFKTLLKDVDVMSFFPLCAGG